MNLLARILTPKTVVHAHCDLPCGVYDPAQARIEAESVEGDHREVPGRTTTRRSRPGPLIIKEQRADLVKHHLWVLWTDYFKPEHLEKYPQLHDAVLEGHQAGRRGGREGPHDPAVAQQLLDQIAEIDTIFWATKKA